MLRGPGLKLKKKWCNLMHSGHSRVRYFQTKNQQQQILFAIFFFSTNRGVHINKQLHVIKGSEAKDFFKK